MYQRKVIWINIDVDNHVPLLEATSRDLKKPVDPMELDPLDELIGLMSCKNEVVPKKSHLD